MGARVTEGPLGGRSTAAGGLGDPLVPGILPAHPRVPPQLSSPGPASGPSPPWPWGPACLLFTGKEVPESESQPAHGVGEG